MNPEQWLSLKWNGGSTMSDRWLNQSKIIHLAFATRFIGRAMIDGISFEIYLCHYMFIVGPVSVMYITGNWIINSIIAVCIALLFAVILHKLSKGMRKILRIHGT